MFGSQVWANPPGSIEFFENRIRPTLVQHCYECHSAGADEIGGSLLLDSSGGMMVGGDSGPAIQPGDAEASLLISALRYESTEMPPDGKLSEDVIESFEQWIAAGAIDPRKTPGSPKHKRATIDLDKGRQFWAFQPLAHSPIPNSGHGEASGVIDEFLNQRLLDAGVIANGMANPAVRLRRLAMDLTGLPPSLDLQESWLADPTESHWARIVDELLSSPEFGEHWARHWMDVARYADSNGSDFNATHHEAWRFRQYLIQSFASDRPIDELIRQQVAGDLLPAESEQQRHDNIVASTFLMVGTKMLSERDKAKLTLDVVDEQIDTVGRAFLGLTLGCARCHDHKFDPIPTEDYYALAGIFKSTVTLKGESQKYVSTWNRVSLPSSDQHRLEVKTHESEVAKLQKSIKEAESEVKSLSKSQAKLAGVVVDDSEATTTGSWTTSTFSKNFVGKNYIHDNNSNKGEATIRFVTRLPKTDRYEVRYSHSGASNRAAHIPIKITTATGMETLEMDQRKVRIEPMWSSLGVFEFSHEQDAIVEVSNAGTNGYVIADAVQFLAKSDSASTEIKPTDVDEGKELAAAKEQLAELKKELSKLKANAPAPLPLAMAPTDASTDKVSDSHVHIRGEVKNLGEIVPRGFLQVCSLGDATIGQPQGSGRAELADWLTDPDNPLVARVFVNRVWMHLMGEGIVRTVDNFGIQGERPTHPAMLDHLATNFLRSGWHVKRLIREIVTSHAYNRSSDFASESADVDPENRLLWRAHRRRIPAEAIRDAMLKIAGELDRRPRTETMKGLGTLVSSNSADSSASFSIDTPCRSIYVPVVRGYVAPLMAALDSADPDLLVGKRPTTNVPGQALVLINSPEVNRWAQQTSQRIFESTQDHDARLMLAFQLCLQRAPQVEDIQIANEHFMDREDSLDAWHQFVAAIFAGTEFRLLD